MKTRHRVWQYKKCLKELEKLEKIEKVKKDLEETVDNLVLCTVAGDSKLLKKNLLMMSS